MSVCAVADSLALCRDMFMPCLLCNGVISQRSCAIVWYDVCIMCNHRFNMSDVFANIDLYLHNMFTNVA